MFYGVVQEEYLYEIDFKQAISVVKYKIKNAILRFIDKIDAWLDNHKDSKIKSLIQSLLQNARKLLVRCKDIETESDAKFIAKELDEYIENFKESTDIKLDHVDVHLDEKDIDKIKQMIVNKIDYGFNIHNDYLNTKSDFGLPKYDLNDLYKTVTTYGKYVFTNIQISVCNILQDKLFETEMYTGKSKALYQSGYYEYVFFDSGKLEGADKLDYKYAKKIQEMFKPNKYNGKTVEKYFEDSKNYIINSGLYYAKQLEALFNKLTKESEILVYKKEKEFQDKLSNLGKSDNK